ncbi:serine hydrolase domain-containing protein [soil metagenome]
MIRRLILLALLLSFQFACTSYNEQDEQRQAFEPGQPDENGMYADSLSLVTRFLEETIQENKIPGAVAMIVKDNRVVYQQALGYSDVEQELLLEHDHIFRLASMTKAITSVGVVMLAERGSLNFDDPVSRYIPEFSNPEVLEFVSFSDSSWTATPAKREVTVHDLLTHTAGLSYGFIDSTMNVIYKKREIPDGIATDGRTIAETMHELAGLPLRHEPGSRWTYGLSTDMLGRVIEVVSGQTLDQFFEEEIFEPLGMSYTRFFLTPAKQEHLVPLYRNTARNSLERVSALSLNNTEDIDTEYSNEASRSYFSGGAGLQGTAEDYQRFLQMVLNRGELGTVKLFGEQSASVLFESQIGDLRVGLDGFSYGFLITLPDGDLKNLRKPGRMQWGGLYQTLFWIDPERNTTVVLLTQVFPSAHQQEIYDGFERKVNSSFK